MRRPVTSEPEDNASQGQGPGVFTKSELCVINKIDKLPHVPFDIAAAHDNARKVHPGMDLLEVSCTTRQGLEEWL